MFDWHSFWINVLSGTIFFVLGIVFTIWIVPKLSFKFLRKKDKALIIRKLSSIIQELCELLIDTPFKDKGLNYSQISVFTSKKEIKNYRFVALCPINVFSKLVYAKMTLVIYEYFKKFDPDKAYIELQKEYARLKAFQVQLEKILTSHSKYIDQSILLKISDICSEIRTYEIDYSMNITYDDLLNKTNSKRDGVFGLNGIPNIYEKVLYLIKEIIELKFFEYKIAASKKFHPQY